MPRERCEDAPCCGHGGVCGQALGMSYDSYMDGFDERSDEQIKADVYAELDDGPAYAPLDDPEFWPVRD